MLPSVQIKAMLRCQRDRDNYDWLYEISRSPEIATLAVGMMMSTAAQNPAWTFLQLLQYLREHLQVVKVKTRDDELDGRTT